MPRDITTRSSIEEIVEAFADGIPESFQRLSKDDKKTVLTKTDAYKLTPLLQALYFGGRYVVTTSSGEQQIESGNSALYFAPQHLLQALTELDDQDTLAKVLLHQDNINQSALMVSFSQNMSYLRKPLYEAINKLPFEKQQALYQQRNFKNVTVLDVALAQGQIMDVMRLVEELKGLEDDHETLRALLTNETPIFGSTLHNAVRIGDTERAKIIIDLMQAHLNSEEINTILTSWNSQGKTPLEFALKRNPAMIGVFIPLLEPETAYAEIIKMTKNANKKLISLVQSMDTTAQLQVIPLFLMLAPKEKILALAKAVASNNDKEPIQKILNYLVSTSSQEDLQVNVLKAIPRDGLLDIIKTLPEEDQLTLLTTCTENDDMKNHLKGKGIGMFKSKDWIPVFETYKESLGPKKPQKPDAAEGDQIDRLTGHLDI